MVMMSHNDNDASQSIDPTYCVIVFVYMLLNKYIDFLKENVSLKFLCIHTSTAYNNAHM